MTLEEALPLAFHDVAGIFPLMNDDEFRQLVADIATHGQREPIITHQGLIIDGRNRFRACLELDLAPVTREWDGEGDPTAYVVSLNLHRRHLNDSQRAMIAARLRGVLQVEPTANLQSSGDRAATAAEALNVSERSTYSAAAVLDRGTPELAAAVDRGEVAVSAAAAVAELPPDEQEAIVARGAKEIKAKARELRQAERQAKREARTEMHRTIAAGNRELDFGDRRFAVVEADPPWEFGNKGVNGAAEGHYPTMTTAEICALPVKRHATAEAVCFLWVPNALLPDGLKVLEAWGFEFKTAEVWDKGPGNNGTGFYDHQDHELLLIGVRGGNMTPVVRFSSVIRAPKGEHSAKPDLAYERIEAMYPEAPRLSLFRRAPRDGWEAWGNQADGEVSP